MGGYSNELRRPTGDRHLAANHDNPFFSHSRHQRDRVCTVREPAGRMRRLEEMLKGGNPEDGDKKCWYCPRRRRLSGWCLLVPPWPCVGVRSHAVCVLPSWADPRFQRAGTLAGTLHAQSTRNRLNPKFGDFSSPTPTRKRSLEKKKKICLVFEYDLSTGFCPASFINWPNLAENRLLAKMKAWTFAVQLFLFDCEYGCTGKLVTADLAVAIALHY